MEAFICATDAGREGKLIFRFVYEKARCEKPFYRLWIHLKMTLTIKEAAEYSNIGINKIDTMLKQPNCPFVLFVGTRKLVKRREFEEYIRREVVI